jgi:hypothetical protein
MNEEGTQDERLSNPGIANDLRTSAPDGRNLALWQTAEPMGARRDLERAVLPGTGFKVHPHCDKLFEELGRWLDEH